MERFEMNFAYKRRFSCWSENKFLNVSPLDKYLVTIEEDWSQVFYIKDFNELSERNVVHLVDVETGEDCLMWAERITNIKKVEADAI